MNMGRISKETLEKENLIADRTMRDKCVERYEVLEKVKEVFLLPGTDMMSINQVAEFYEVTPRLIQYVYANNTEEIKSDGIEMLSRDYYETINGDEKFFTSVNKNQFSVTYTFNNGEVITINNRGLRAFSKRAVLRIGMLLRDSPVAREIRNQLLNIEEKVDDETKVQDITEEQRLMLNVGMAYASGNMDAVLKATTEYTAFQNRHIQKLEHDNKALANGILEWSDRSKLSAGVRCLASTTGIPFANVWNELYKNLQYQYGICLKQRGSKPYIQWVKQNEWNKIIKTFSAMCEAYHQSPTEMFQQTTPKCKY